MPTANRTRLFSIAAALFLCLTLTPSEALAQAGGPYDLSWNTIDGGGATFSTGGAFSVGGTIGQPDAGVSSGGTFTLRGGFWPVTVCAADFNGDGTVNINDFLAFLNAFSSGDPRADFNEDGAITIADFLAYLNAFALGCV